MNEIKDYQLDDGIYKEVTRLSQLAEDYFEEENFGPALELYKQALDLLPEPKIEWEAATWLYAAIGDTHWLLADYQNALNAFSEALKGPGGIGNPFVHLRMGQLAATHGDMTRARDELIRAYMGAGDEIFEEEDEEYFNLIKDLIDP